MPPRPGSTVGEGRPGDGRALRLALLQVAPVPRAPAQNLGRLVTAARELQVDLVLTPELSLTGYDLRDDAPGLALRVAHGQPLPASDHLPKSTMEELERLHGHLVLGLVEEGPEGTPFNTAVVLRAGRVVFGHRKLYLPTYGMFDEGRYFGRGSRVDTLPLAHGWRAGILVCEDLWHPVLPYLCATAGANLLLVQAAAPGRGVWEGGSDGARFGSWDSWVRIARTTAELLGVYVAVCNRVGVEGGITFAGGSLVAGPDGAIVKAATEGEERLEVELSLAELARARRPYAHARDEDPHLVLRELRRLLEHPR